MKSVTIEALVLQWERNEALNKSLRHAFNDRKTHLTNKT